MKRFIEGQGRQQVTLLPECLDDYVAEDNPVRIVDAFVEALDLQALGFASTKPALTRRPSYHPSVLLKLYIYGYLNRIQSSRRLEREAQRNVELMWLTDRLAPDFKTIADFRDDNGTGIRNVCQRFIVLCRQLKLFTQAIVAIDGSKFKAVNSRDRNFTVGKVDKRQEQIEILREQMQQFDEVKRQLKDVPDGQISLTDPDARSMVSQAKGSGLVGYNVQTEVDAKHHLIVAHEVTNVGNDRAQLHKMALAARETMGKKRFKAFADRGYCSGTELKACGDDGITTFVPKPMTSNAKADGRSDKADFVYLAKEDAYRCPAGQHAIYRFSTVEIGRTLHAYWSSACPTCLLLPMPI